MSDPQPPTPTERPTEGILDFLVRISPHLRKPNWFAPYAAKLEEARHRPLRVVFAAPPQHGKTEVTKHAFVWHLLKDAKSHGYVSYAAERAYDVGWETRQIAAEAGIVTDGSRRRWRVIGGGGTINWTGIGGPLTGYGIDGILVVDDPVKDAKEASSKVIRERHYEWLKKVALTRLRPGASCIVMATRWDIDDLSGRLINEGWDYVRQPALAEGNDPMGRAVDEPLAPEIRSKEFLDKVRQEIGELAWASLYQQRPRPIGGHVFRGTRFYTRLPEQYTGAYGLDLAYTAKKAADWSICLELWQERRHGEPPLYYVVNVDRAQVEADQFALTLRARHVRRSNWPMMWRASGTEKGVVSLLARFGVHINRQSPPGDKLFSAQEIAVEWNKGHVLVPDPHIFPDCEAWLYHFLEVMHGFTGSGREKDDDVDALGSAYAALQNEETGGWLIVNRKN